MGRLRSGKDAALFCRIAAEVVDLYGTTDCTLYRFSAALDENLAGKDPLWDEPKVTPTYEKFKLPCHWFDYNTTANPSEFGRDDEVDATAYISLNHLISAGVPSDENKEYVEPGDILSVHDKCGRETQFYDIIQTNRDGWVDSSDQYTGYNLELKRRAKYVPNRKTQDD